MLPWTLSQVIERAEEGPVSSEKDFDLRILAPKLNEVVKEYDIHFDREQIIPSDDSLADDLWKAAFELYLEVGTFCITSSRRILFREDEIKEALAHATSHISVGCGRDARDMYHRDVEDERRPFASLGPMGQSCDEELFVPISMAYMQEPIADGMTAPMLERINGIAIKAGAPSEVVGAVAHAMMLREAARRVGRPGMFVMSVATAATDGAQIAASNPEWGERVSDGRFVGALAELKVDYSLLRKAVHFHQYGCFVSTLSGPIVGGYTGTEGAAVLGVAYHLQGLLVSQSHLTCSFPIHMKHSCTTAPETLWSTGLVEQAVARNSKLISFTKGKAAAGPCTDMVLHEAAAQGLIGTVSGGNLYMIAAARDRQKERFTPMEAKTAAEVGQAAADMRLKRSDANEIAKKIISKYEGNLENAPLGEKFQECYDIHKLRPTPKHVEVYDKVKAELRDLGLEFSY